MDQTDIFEDKCRIRLKNLRAKDIMITDVVTVGPKETVGRVDLKMIRAAIGGVPVVNEDGELLGIITQRDIMLSRFISTITSSRVEDLMTRNVVTCSPEDTLEIILKKMLENKIERLPVVDGKGKLIGLVVHASILEKLYSIIKDD